MKISVVGLGKLGLCTAACFASAGFTVFGYDLNDRIRNELKKRRCPILETGLEELLQTVWPALRIVDSYQEAVANSDITLIIVPTPSMPDGRFAHDNVLKALEGLAPALAAKETFHVVDVVSTVMPGSSDGVFRPLLERLTGKRCGSDFGLAYNPEFIALGSVIRDFLNPDMVLIGASDDTSGFLLSELYRITCRTRPTIALMSLINAEITKISLNCFVTMKISFANTLTSVCERVPGADVDAVTTAMGADSRVGSKYLKGGLGFGGPCFPRDNIAFQAFAEEFGAEAILGKAVVAVNNDVPGRLLSRITSHTAPPAKVALLGLSYKAGTHIIEDSQSVMLAKSLVAAGYQPALHDPLALESARQLLGDSASYSGDPYVTCAGASAIALLTDWPHYRSLDWQRIASLASPGALVLDSWRIARDTDMSAFAYAPVGVGGKN